MKSISRKKRNKIWLIDKNILQEIAAHSSSLNEIFSKLKIDNKSASYKVLRAKIKTDNIDISHIQLGRGHNKGRTFKNASKRLLSDVLIENSDYSRSCLKQRLLKEGLLKNQCDICGQLPEWNGKPLSLQIDHINGINDDNRLENLRILCGHCHSQTETFAGKRMKINKPPSPSELNPNWRNAPRPSTYKVQRPSKEELEKILWELPTIQIGKKYGVSDNAVAKWAKSYGLSKPPRGYWQKKAS